MKLIDILARELKVWPEGTIRLLQSEEGFIFFQPGFPRGTQCVLTTQKAEDWAKNLVITRPEWQAAVDALAYQDMHDVALKGPVIKSATTPNEKGGRHAPHADELYLLGGFGSRDHHGTLASTGEQVSVRWKSEALPPIGTNVKIHDDGSLVYGHGESGEVIAHVEDCAVVRMSYGLGCFMAKVLRSAEQIAAEEREAEIHDLVNILGEVRSAVYKDIAKAIQKGGFRKQVAK